MLGKWLTCLFFLRVMFTSFILNTTVGGCVHCSSSIVGLAGEHNLNVPISKILDPAGTCWLLEINININPLVSQRLKGKSVTFIDRRPADR